MIHFKQKWDGWLIANKIFFGTTWEEKNDIVLRFEKWDAMRYGKNDTNIVEFPWEYDIKDISIACFEADKKLSYVIGLADQRIALLQNPAALEVASFDKIDTRLCLDDTVKEEVERLEMEGEIGVLKSEEESKWVDGKKE